MIANEVISNAIFPLRKQDTAEDILTMLSMNRLKELPVVDEGKLLGIISEGQAYEMTSTQTISDILIPGQVIQVDKHTHIFELISKMALHNLTMIPIVDDKDQTFKGIVTQEDVFNFYAKSFSFKEPGSIVVVEMSRRSYSMAEISQIVESEGAAILSSFLSNASDIEKIIVTIKINKLDIRSIIAGFERYSYEVKASYTEQEYYDNLKDRYDMLMHYLDV